LPTSLITGANGFIGSTMAEYLIAKGQRVICMVRKTSDLSNLKGLAVEYRFGDISSPESLPPALAKVNTVYHFAGLTKAKTKADFYRVNGEGVGNLAKASLKAGVSQFIYISSLAAMGPQTGNDLLNETMTPFPITTYGRSKLLGEVRLQEICGNRTFWSIIRPGGVYGPKDKDIFLYFKTINHGWIIIPSGKERIIPLIHVCDLAELCYLSAQKIVSGEIFLATDGVAHTWVSVAETIARVLNRKGVRIIVPLPLTSVLAFASELVGNAQGKLSPLNREKVRELRACWGVNMEKARNILGFKIDYPLEKGLRDTAQWYWTNGWLAR
jgi:nucleoside-diphosphate-sugar epimerase